MRAVVAAAMVLVSSASFGDKADKSGVKTDKQPVEVEMRNVDLHLTPDISVQIHHLRGRFIAEGARQIPYLDDPTSYSVTIDTGEVAIDLASLNAMMTRTLQGHSNVSGLKITIDEEGRLRQRGTVKKGIPVPFDVKAQTSVTPDGKIRVHSESVKGFGVPVNPLLKAFGIELDDLLKVDPGRGISVQGNDLILDPTRLLPPPAMHGTITAVRIEHNAMVQTFGSGARRPVDVRQADDDRDRSRAHRRRPKGSVRLLRRSLERCPDSRLLEGDARARTQSAHAGLQRSLARSEVKRQRAQVRSRAARREERDGSVLGRPRRRNRRPCRQRLVDSHSQGRSHQGRD